MSGPGRIARLLAEGVLLAGLLAASLLAVRAHQEDDAPTSDEGIHLASGMEALEDGSGWLNPEHPPLLKMAAAAAARPLGLSSPCAVLPCASSSPLAGYTRWLYGNSAPPHAMVAAGRRPFPWLLGGLAVAMHLGVRRYAGPAAGLVAAGLVALDPGFVAHAAYVHTDVGAALAFLAVVLLAARSAAGTTLGPWLALGLALGLALVTKFSAALLVPVVLLAPLLGFRRRARGGEAAAEPPAASRDRVAGAAVALGLAGLVVFGVYSFALRRMSPRAAEESIRGYLAGRDARPDEVERHGRLARLSPPVGHYVGGLKGVALLSERGRGTNWFRGETSERPFPLYFPAAFLLKSTPAFLCLLALAGVAGIARLARRPRKPPPREVVLAVLLPLAVAGLYFVSSMRSSFNIGARHLLPVWALATFAAAVVVGRRLEARPRARAAGGVLLVASAAGSLLSAGASPIAWFNPLAGGPDGGRAWFSDSNVDWGQDLYRLHLFLRERGWEESTTIVAYGGVATNYFSRRARVLDPAVPIAPGRYAVSHMMETLGPSFVRGVEGEEAARQVEELVGELRARGRRLALVGGSITVWELPPPEGNASPRE